VNKLKEKEFLKSFGRNLKSIREKKKITQSYLADTTNISRSQIIRIENGESNTTILTIKALTEGMNIDKKELLNF